LSGIALIFDVLSGTASASLVENLVMSGIAGIFAGVAVAVTRAWPKKAGHTSETFVSALFSKGLAAQTLDGVFWERVLIGGIIGLAVGALTGVCGAISVFSTDAAANVLRDTTFPIVVFLAGGYGGPGGAGFWAILFLILVIILTALLVGLFAGLIVHLCVLALAGMVKGTTKAMVLEGLGEKSGGETAKKSHPVKAGMVRGMLAGLLTGIVEAIFTTWGVLNLPAVPPH